MQSTKIDTRLFIIGMLLVISTMVVATQFAITDAEYEYYIGPIPDYGVKFIGSDNSSDGIRVLRADPNGEDGCLKIVLGNVSTNCQWAYSAAFGIVNEEKFSMGITHIEVSSSNPTYMKIWLHGNGSANANNLSTDPTSVLMYDNGTIVNESNTIAWVLADGDNNASTICGNVTNRNESTIDLKWDEIAGVRYSLNNTNVASEISDFVWVQVELNIPSSVDGGGGHTGTIYIHFGTD